MTKVFHCRKCLSVLAGIVTGGGGYACRNGHNLGDPVFDETVVEVRLGVVVAERNRPKVTYDEILWDASQFLAPWGRCGKCLGRMAFKNVEVGNVRTKKLYSTCVECGGDKLLVLPLDGRVMATRDRRVEM